MSDFKNYLNTFVFDTVLPGSGETIKFKPITTGQLKNMLLYENIDEPHKIEEALDQLIQECVVNEDFNVDDLYLQDRFFLLVEIRKSSKGNTYSFQLKCSSCDSQSIINIDLNDLIVKKFKGNEQQNETLISVNKKNKNKVIEDSFNDIIELENKLKLQLQFPTRGMQKEIFNRLYNNKKITDIQRNVELITNLQAISIKSIILPDGETFDNYHDRLYLSNNIRQIDQDKITDWLSQNDFGLDFTFTQKCSHCGKEIKRDIPLEDFFF